MFGYFNDLCEGVSSLSKEPFSCALGVKDNAYGEAFSRTSREQLLDKGNTFLNAWCEKPKADRA
jgi:hypothetical protein